MANATLNPTATDLLRLEEAAVMCGVSWRTILRWADEGRLTAVKLPRGGVRFRRDEVEKLAAAAAAK